MTPEIVIFAVAVVLLVIVIYGVLSHHRRDRAAIRAAEEITRRRDRENERVGQDLRQTAVPPRPVEPNGVEPDFSEDDIQRAQFGPRGVPGAPDPARMTPQRAKKTPTYIDQGHVS